MKEALWRIGQGTGFKVFVILVLVGVLSLVLGMQDTLVDERQGFRDQAVSRTVGEWGGEQRFAGPFLRIPYRKTLVEGQGSERHTWEREAFAYLLPEEFSARTALAAQTRTRGIYEVPLYRAEVQVGGRFVLDTGRDWFPTGAQVDWDKAEVWYFLTGGRGLDDRPEVTWDGQPQESLRALTGEKLDSFDAFRFPVAMPRPGASVAFQMHLALRGGASFGIFPAGQDSLVQVDLDRGFPEFGGAFLPSEWKTVGPGFTSVWRIPSLARALPAQGTSETWGPVLGTMGFATFELGGAFDAYRSIDRALKYGLLFIIVPFVGLFLYEVFTRSRLHPVQYLLVGLAVLMFYLLVLSLSERMPFDPAFLLGGLAVCALLGVYSASILGGRWSGLWFSLGMAGLYGLLYLIIRSEDNALLVGTLFLFVLLAVVMVATRGVDWFRVGRGPAVEDRP